EVREAHRTRPISCSLSNEGDRFTSLNVRFRCVYAYRSTPALAPPPPLIFFCSRSLNSLTDSHLRLRALIRPCLFFCTSVFLAFSLMVFVLSRIVVVIARVAIDMHSWLLFARRRHQERDCSLHPTTRDC